TSAITFNCGQVYSYSTSGSWTPTLSARGIGNSPGMWDLDTGRHHTGGVCGRKDYSDLFGFWLWMSSKASSTTSPSPGPALVGIRWPDGRSVCAVTSARDARLPGKTVSPEPASVPGGFRFVGTRLRAEILGHRKTRIAATTMIRTMVMIDMKCAP